MSTVDESAGASAEREPSWRHRDHPTFASLSGFFTGLLFVILVPGVYAALLSVLVDTDTAEELFPLVLVTLGIPIGLVVAPRTRRFGRFMLVGIVTTAVVVLASAGLVLWILYSTDA
ncbi:hypothetical protein [Nocardioides lianchengensis]|uniref:Uncharacterized protein n=1 Tax=Nocardioides lianchengensis TaxID=1045774 RepID=A0A1G6N9H6_9ACTN|nr:hypothetical protein [Nocardioides lianchengensis]NYG10705.1 hypothetical protein [Nocardioides lianchengensis]SDC64499.1 hypothetical protein SAMN05421872_103188 [Nocardioides lianchengensis]